MRTAMLVSWTVRDHGKYHEEIQKVQKFKILHGRHDKNWKQKINCYFNSVQLQAELKPTRVAPAINALILYQRNEVHVGRIYYFTGEQ